MTGDFMGDGGAGRGWTDRHIPYARSVANGEYELGIYAKQINGFIFLMHRVEYWNIIDAEWGYFTYIPHVSFTTLQCLVLVGFSGKSGSCTTFFFPFFSPSSAFFFMSFF